MTTALVRAPFQPLEVEESWDKDLLEQAAKLIGYRPKALAAAEQTRTRSLNENIFARALKSLDIEPFTIRSVEAYKARMVREACKGQSWPCTQYMHRSGQYRMEKGQTVVHAVGWPSWLTLAATAVPSLVCHFSGYMAGWGWGGHRSLEIIKYTPWSQVLALAGIPLVGVAAWGALMFLRHKKAHAMLANWGIKSVSEYYNGNGAYDEAIPAFAVQRMLSLKKELPEVTFSVEQLNAEKVDLNTEKRIKLPPDPFLIATFRGVSAYIDVWDEPKFEGRRTV